MSVTPQEKYVRQGFLSNDSTFKDRYGDDVTVNANYILYRNRSIDMESMMEIRVKARSLLINSFKQNTTRPTMCIHFKTKEDAIRVHTTMLSRQYNLDRSVSRRGGLVYDA